MDTNAPTPTPFDRFKHFLTSCLPIFHHSARTTRPSGENSQRTKEMKAMFDRSVQIQKPIAPPKHFGAYILSTKIGSGSFGTVHICKHRKTKMTYAGKFFDIAFVKDDDNLNMIYSEVETLKKLSHNNTISFVDLVFSRHGALLVMELVQGRKLQRMITKNTGMVESFARVLFVQLLNAVKHLHSQRIIHRDIKVENIMIDNRGTLKLIDYGLAEIVPLETLEKDGLIVSGICGTRSYYAPEIISAIEDDAVGDDDPEFAGDKLDIWAIGVFLYSIVAGRRPFSGRNRAELRHNISNVSLNYDTLDFSPELLDLLRSMFTLDPSERPSIDEILSHPWTKGSRLKDTDDAVFGSPTGEVRVQLVNGASRETQSCPKTFLQQDRTIRLSHRKAVSCHRLSGWRIESSIKPTSENGTSSSSSTVLNASYLSSEYDDSYLSDEFEETSSSPEENTRHWVYGATLRTSYCTLKSVVQNFHDHLRGRVVRNSLCPEDLQQIW